MKKNIKQMFYNMCLTAAVFVAGIAHCEEGADKQQNNNPVKTSQQKQLRLIDKETYSSGSHGSSTRTDVLYFDTDGDLSSTEVVLKIDSPDHSALSTRGFFCMPIQTAIHDSAKRPMTKEQWNTLLNSGKKCGSGKNVYYVHGKDCGGHFYNWYEKGNSRE